MDIKTGQFPFQGTARFLNLGRRRPAIATHWALSVGSLPFVIG
jgi:hypothetical protein